MSSLFGSTSTPPPFLLDEVAREVGLQFVFFGSDPTQVEREFKTVTASWPKESVTQTQVVSAPNVPGAGIAFFIERLMPESESINGHRVRLHVFGSTAPIEGPDSAAQAVLLRQAACVVVLDGSTARAVAALHALLASVESQPKRPPVVVFVGQKPESVPEDWSSLVAPSASEAVDNGFRRIASLIE